MITPETIAQALAGERQPQRKAIGWLTWCPCHADQNPSLSISEGSTGKILVKCFAGCSNPAVIDELKARDLWRFQNGDRLHVQNPRIVATYDYEDAHGQLLFQVVRKEPGKDGKNKDFQQRRPDGEGGWIWNVEGVPRVPYRLPEVLRADTVFIVEGEKDSDSLVRIGLTATCNPGGAGKWRALYNPHFQGKAVAILPDNDGPGRAHAQKVAQQLHCIASSIKVVELPGPPKSDVSDWLKVGGTVEQLQALVEAAPEWRAEPNSPLIDTPYLIQNGALYYNKNTRQGPVPVCITNFIAECEAEITRDDGLNRSIEFVMSGTLDSGQKLPPVTVKAS
jgi:putative DNA primase/helicase